MSQISKNAALPRQAQSKAKLAAAKPSRLLPVLVIASIAVVIIGILLLKDRQQRAVVLSAPPASRPTAQGSSSAPGRPTTVSGPAVVAGPFRTSSPADQLSQALAQGKPTLVFMHSTTCKSCTDLMKVVDEVYPEFANQVVLVDVDIYDSANSQLIQALGLRYIPTLVVYDRKGKAAQNVGAMQPDAFRTFLRQSALGG